MLRLFSDFDAQAGYFRKGGEARVFGARHRLDGQLYAIKQHPLGTAGIERVAGEARILAQLHHPNIVRYYGSWVGPYLLPSTTRACLTVGETSQVSSSLDSDEGEPEESAAPSRTRSMPNLTRLDKLPPQISRSASTHDLCAAPDMCLHLQLEFCPTSMAEILYCTKECWPPATQRCRWAVEVLRTLEHLHARGMHHGDLKPANVLLDAQGVTKLTDFGMANTQGTGAYGTVPYASPEQLERGVGSAQADMYAFGVLLVDLLWHSQTGMDRARRIACFKTRAQQPPAERMGDKPSARYLIEACLRTDPAERIMACDVLHVLARHRDFSLPLEDSDACDLEPSGVPRLPWSEVV